MRPLKSPQAYLAVLACWGKLVRELRWTEVYYRTIMIGLRGMARSAGHFPLVRSRDRGLKRAGVGGLPSLH